jgi:type I restriction enzyme S subunit
MTRERRRIVGGGNKIRSDIRGEWRQEFLADIVDIISGGTPKTTVNDYWNGDIPWLSVADFNKDLRWVSTAEKHITTAGLSESPTTLLTRGDIIISARGTVGALAQVARPMAFNQSCYGIRGKSGVALNDYLFYTLRQAVPGMKQVSHGGVFDTITRDTFKILRIQLPPVSEQRAIAKILGTLDDKIELNRRMNETLESMARALFKSWFVDFDPVRAKAAGRDPGLPKELAALFPDSFQDSELGEIPKGWEVRPFSGTVEIIGGGTPQTDMSEYWNGNIPWFSVVDAPTVSDVWVLITEKKITQRGIENSSTRILPIGTTIISARGTVGRVALVGVPMAMNQSCYGLRGTIGQNGYFNYFAVREIVSLLQQRAHGSIFDTITRDTLAGIPVAVPPSLIVDAYEICAGKILEHIRRCIFESHILATLRDTLLPKLISGNLRVEGAATRRQSIPEENPKDLQ